MEAKPYELNYDWGRLYDWSEEESDVSLEVVVESADLPAVRAGVDRWVGGFERSAAVVDGLYIDYFYEGGCWFQLLPGTDTRTGTGTGTGESLRLWINSSGQDAFDSIHWYAQELFALVTQIDSRAQIAWKELPHRRRTWQHLPA